MSEGGMLAGHSRSIAYEVGALVMCGSGSDSWRAICRQSFRDFVAYKRERAAALDEEVLTPIASRPFSPLLRSSASLFERIVNVEHSWRAVDVPFLTQARRMPPTQVQMVEAELAASAQDLRARENHLTSLEETKRQIEERYLVAADV